MVQFGSVFNADSEQSGIHDPPPQNHDNTVMVPAEPMITGHRLNGGNYLQWSQMARIFICGRGKIEYLTGENAITDASDPKYKKWTQEDHLMSWLFNSMQPEIAENFLLYKTAKAIWNAVEETYSCSDNTAIIQR